MQGEGIWLWLDKLCVCVRVHEWVGFDANHTSSWGKFIFLYFMLSSMKMSFSHFLDKSTFVPIDFAAAFDAQKFGLNVINASSILAFSLQHSSMWCISGGSV